MHIPFCESPLDAYRGSGPLVTKPSQIHDQLNAHRGSGPLVTEETHIRNPLDAYRGRGKPRTPKPLATEKKKPGRKKKPVKKVQIIVTNEPIVLEFD